MHVKNHYCSQAILRSKLGGDRKRFNAIRIIQICHKKCDRLNVSLLKNAQRWQRQVFP